MQALSKVKSVKYLQKYDYYMCETLDEIHEAQLAALLAKMRKETKVKQEKPIEVVAN